MKKILLSAGMLLAMFSAKAQCEAVTALNEDFSNFTISQGWTPENCWNKIAPGVLIYTAQSGDPANQYVTFYASTAVNTAGYLTTPEINTIDGAHQLSFSTWRIVQGPGEPAGNVTVQVGTVTDVADGSTFTAFGDAFTVNATTPETHSNIVIPATTAAGTHIAFKIISDTAHNAIGIDNVVWNEVPAPACAAVETLNEDFSNFTIGTSWAGENCWNKIALGFAGGGGMIYTAEDSEPANQYITYYAANAVNVNSYLTSPEISTLDGEHQLSFTAWKLAMNGTVPAGTVTVQVGTMADVADSATFVAFGNAFTVTTDEAQTFDNIVIPSAAAGSHIAFRLSADTAHNAIGIDNIVWEEVPAPACAAVETLNEDFSNFTIGTSWAGENCWNKIALGFAGGGGMIYTAEDSEPANQYITYYAANAVNVNSYLASPEISTFDGGHELSFTAWKLAMNGTVPAGTVTVQVGTMADVADATTFVAFGDAFTVTTDEAQTFDNIVIPSAAAGSHIAFRLSADTAHTAIALDNVVWQSVTAGTGTVKANAFSVYPNPTANKNVTLTYNNIDNGRVSVYSLTGAKVYETTVSGTSKDINLSALSAGMYVVKLESGTITASQKLIVQ